MLFWLSETGKIWGFQAFWSCSVNFPHYGDPLAWNWSYLGFLGIIWRTCGSKCRGEGGGIFPTLCVECCLVWITSQMAYTFYQPHLCPLRNQLQTYQLMTKQFSMTWSHWYRSIWWSYCTNFSLGNFSILLLLSHYQLDTDISHILWLMFLCVPRCIITWHVRIFHTWKLKVGLDLCYCGKEVKLLLWISWTILSCKFLRKPLSQYGKESN